MDITFLIFISSGLFLGWSLGANDAANIFGTAVGTRMIRFSTAAIICSIFVVLGAVISGGGTSETIANFGGVNRIEGAFIVALAAALAVFITLKSGITASTSQAIIGALVGWNFYTEAVLDTDMLLMIISTWILCPLLAGLIAIALTWKTGKLLGYFKPHLLRQDMLIRLALIMTGGLGAYALGANNIGNVMGVFIDVSPFRNISIAGITLSALQQLFLLGGLAVAVGVFTYSKHIMMTIGNGIMEISPISAWIVVFAHSIVLLLFSSRALEQWLLEMDMPTLPLVPVSSSQAVIGAMVGLALLKGGKGINWQILRHISLGWLITPLMACLISLSGLFLFEHVGQQEVYKAERYQLTPEALTRLATEGLETWRFAHLSDVPFTSARQFIDRIQGYTPLNQTQKNLLLHYAFRSHFTLNYRLYRTDSNWLSAPQWQAINAIKEQIFNYRWQLREALATRSEAWKPRSDTLKNRTYNKALEQQYLKLERLFEAPPSPGG